MRIRASLCLTLLSLLVVSVAAAQEPAAVPPAPPAEEIAVVAPSEPLPARVPRMGIGIRGGSFGVPNVVVDQFVEQHPDISGTVYGAEIRYYGTDGPRGPLSLAVTFDLGSTSADGIWQAEVDDDPIQADGEMDMWAITITGYWDIFSSSPVHPFIGIGIGYSSISGNYRDEDTKVTVEGSIPAIHIPVGLALHLGDHITARAEARIINAVSFGGSLMFNF